MSRGKTPWGWIFAGIGLASLAGWFTVYKLRGLRNNNPGNIREFRAEGWKHWQGAIGVDAEFHLIFATPFHGVRAIFENLLGYNRNHDIQTLTQIFTRWAPSNDPDANNNPTAYAASVSDATGIGVDAEIDFHNAQAMISIAKAITKEENANVNPYSDNLYASAWAAA